MYQKRNISNSNIDTFFRGVENIISVSRIFKYHPSRKNAARIINLRVLRSTKKKVIRDVGFFTNFILRRFGDFMPIKFLNLNMGNSFWSKSFYDL